MRVCSQVHSSTQVQIHKCHSMPVEVRGQPAEKLLSCLLEATVCTAYSRLASVSRLPLPPLSGNAMTPAVHYLKQLSCAFWELNSFC